MPDEHMFPPRRSIERDRSADLRWIALARLLVDLAEQLSYELNRIDDEIDLAEQLSHELQRVEEMIGELSQRLAQTQGRIDALTSKTEKVPGSIPSVTSVNYLYPYVMTSADRGHQLAAPVSVKVPYRLGSSPNPQAVIRPITRHSNAAAQAQSPTSGLRSMIQTVNQQTRILAAMIAVILLFFAVVGVLASTQPFDSNDPGNPHPEPDVHPSGHTAAVLSSTATARSTRANATSPIETDRPGTPVSSVVTAVSAMPTSTTTAIVTPPITGRDTPQPSTPASSTATVTTLTTPADATNIPAQSDDAQTPTAVAATATLTVTPVPPPVSSAGIVPGGVGSVREQMAQVFGPPDEEVGDRSIYQGGSVLVAFSPANRAISITFLLDTDEQVFTREEADDLAAFYRPPDAEFQVDETADGFARIVYRSATLAALFAGEDVADRQSDVYVEQFRFDPVTDRIQSLEMTLGIVET